MALTEQETKKPHLQPHIESRPGAWRGCRAQARRPQPCTACCQAPSPTGTITFLSRETKGRPSIPTPNCMGDTSHSIHSSLSGREVAFTVFHSQQQTDVNDTQFVSSHLLLSSPDYSQQKTLASNLHSCCEVSF